MEATATGSAGLALLGGRFTSLEQAYGTPTEALAVFLWETQLRAALVAPLEISELAVRNAIDRAATSWWEGLGRSGSWTDAQTPKELGPFEGLAQPRSWTRRAEKRTGRERPSHDDVIAHCSLGTWRNLFSNPANIPRGPLDNANQEASRKAQLLRDARCANLWREVTHGAFPAMPTKGQRGGLSPRVYVSARIERIGSLRNRVFHWDNLLQVNVPARYQDMRELVGAIDPTLQNLMDQTSEQHLCDLWNERPSALQ